MNACKFVREKERVVEKYGKRYKNGCAYLAIAVLKVQV